MKESLDYIITENLVPSGLTRRELQEHEEMNKFVSQFVKTLIAKGKENMAEDDEPSVCHRVWLSTEI